MAEIIERSCQPDFFLVEYQIASEQYRNGVELGMSVIKALITLNGLLLAAVAAVTQAEIQLLGAHYIVYISVTFGFIISTFTAIILPYYFQKLAACEARCIQIENDFGGKLFTDMAGTKNPRKVYYGLLLVCIFFATIWLVVGGAAVMSEQ